MCAGKGAHSLPASRLPSLASPIITLAIAIVARSLRSIDPSWPKAASDATDMLAVSKRMIVELARRISSCGWVAWCERRAPVSLGFRVGNPSAIGWYQPANFPASLVPVGVTPTTSRRIATHVCVGKWPEADRSRDPAYHTGRQKPSPAAGAVFLFGLTSAVSWPPGELMC
jgi:hypothetical protein